MILNGQETAKIVPKRHFSIGFLYCFETADQSKHCVEQGAANGLIRLGSGNVVGKNTFLLWQDPNAVLDIQWAAVATGWGSDGDWIVCIPERCGGKLDAAAATLTGARVGSHRRVGYAGDGYVWFPDEAGDQVQITLAGCEAGPYSMGLNVAVSAAESGRSFAVNVNGVDVGTVGAPPTHASASQCAQSTIGTNCVGNPTSGWSGGCSGTGSAEGWVFAGCYVSDADVPTLDNDFLHH